MDELKEFIDAHPSSALSASYVFELDGEEQKEYIVKIIEDAVYCDSWEAYFSFAHEHQIPISEEVALQAVQSVGLDPLSAPLWLEAIECCPTAERKRELFHLCLSIPLYKSDVLYQAYTQFEEGEHGAVDFTEANSRDVASLLAKEAPWPDRYRELADEAERVAARLAWVALLDSMMATVDSGTVLIAREVQLNRMDLALRQMCRSLPQDDSCWCHYALFQAYILEDVAAAKEIVAAALATVPAGSFALNNLYAMFSHGALPELKQLLVDAHVAPFGAAGEGEGQVGWTLLEQQHAANVLARHKGSKEATKQLRMLGKVAAQQGVSDWRVYAQWCRAEVSVLEDAKMAPMVLENGMICCSSSPKDAILLGTEATHYHVLRRHERESVGSAEKQVEQLSASTDAGRRCAAWVGLVRTEAALGLPYAKAEERRNEVYPRPAILDFLDAYRVGCYAPCTTAEHRSILFDLDFIAQRRSEKDATWRKDATVLGRVVAPGHRASTAPSGEVEHIRPEAWVPYTPEKNTAVPQATDDPDEVVGPLKLRGRWAYRPQLDRKTLARVEREKRRREAAGNDAALATDDSAMGSLVRRLRTVELTEAQTDKVRRLSLDWLLSHLAADELKMQEVLTARKAYYAARRQGQGV